MINPFKRVYTYVVERYAQDKFDHWPTIYLDPKNLKGLKESIESGQLDKQEQLFMAMIQGWPRLKKNLNEVAGAVSRLQWGCTAWAERGQKPTKEDQGIADMVDSAIWRTSPDPTKWEQSTEDLLKSLAYIVACGQTVHEIMWESDDIIYPRAFCPVSAKYYAWAYKHNEPDCLKLYPQGIDRMPDGIDFPPNKFLVGLSKGDLFHPIFNSKLRTLVGWYGASMWGLTWLVNYCQIFGIPFRIAKARGAKAVEEAGKAMKQLASGGYAVSTENFEFEVHDATKSTSSIPQSVLIELADKVCDNLILGQTLTSDNKDGGAYALGKVHEGIRQEVIMDIASVVAEVLNTQLVKYIIQLNYGTLPSRLPRFVPTFPGDEANLDKVEFLQKAKDLGLDIQKDWSYEFLSIPQPSEGDDVLSNDSGDDYPDDYQDDTEDDIDPDEDDIAKAAYERGKYLRLS